MKLFLKKCVSLFLCLSLLLSACSSDKSNKASNFTTRPKTQPETKVKLYYRELCSSSAGYTLVDAEKPINKSIGTTKCITENGKTICKAKWELEKKSLSPTWNDNALHVDYVRLRLSHKGDIFVKAKEPYKSIMSHIDEMKCILENGKTTCTNTKDESKWELKKVNVCDNQPQGTGCFDYMRLRSHKAGCFDYMRLRSHECDTLVGPEKLLDEDDIFMKAEKPFSYESIMGYIGEMKCTTENNEIICTDTKDESKCKLTGAELCYLGKCETFKFDEDKVPCHKSSDTPKGKCLPARLRGKSEKDKKEEEEAAKNFKVAVWPAVKMAETAAGVMTDEEAKAFEGEVKAWVEEMTEMLEDLGPEAVVEWETKEDAPMTELEESARAMMTEEVGEEKVGEEKVTTEMAEAAKTLMEAIKEEALRVAQTKLMLRVAVLELENSTREMKREMHWLMNVLKKMVEEMVKVKLKNVRVTRGAKLPSKVRAMMTKIAWGAKE